jgi:asparagine synthetase B (glutamine-hydrolysing)
MVYDDYSQSHKHAGRPLSMFEPTHNLAEDLRDKQARLFDTLRILGRLAVAFSGGIDSTVVAAAAVQVLGENAIAVTADSASVPRKSASDIFLCKPMSSPIPTT